MQALYLFLDAYKVWEIKEINFSSLKFRTSWYINLLQVKWGLFTFWKPNQNQTSNIYVNFLFISSIFSCFLGKQTYPWKESTTTENYDIFIKKKTTIWLELKKVKYLKIVSVAWTRPLFAFFLNCWAQRERERERGAPKITIMSKMSRMWAY
jgi:hypothetical protein